MKKYLLAIAAIFALHNVQAQHKKSEVETGFVVGPNVSTVLGGQPQDVKPGVTVGAFVELPVTYYKKASFSVGLEYAMQGYKGKKYQQYDLTTFEPLDFKKLDDVTLNYLYLPVKFNFYTKKGFGFFVGGQVGYLVSASGMFDMNYANPARSHLNFADGNLDRYLFEQGYRSKDPRDYYESIDYGVTAGFSFDISEKMFIALSCYYGLQDIYKKDNGYKEQYNLLNNEQAATVLGEDLVNFLKKHWNFDPVNNISVKATFGYRL